MRAYKNAMKLTQHKNGQWMEKQATTQKRVGEAILIAYKIEFKAKTTQVEQVIKFKDVCCQNHFCSSFPPEEKVIIRKMQEGRGHSHSMEWPSIPLPFSSFSSLTAEAGLTGWQIKAQQ